MVEDFVAGTLKTIGRFIVRFFIEIFFELLVKGPGYFISKWLTKEKPDTDSFLVIFTGLFFCLLMGYAGYAFYSNVGTSGNI